jgi:hypothetical protein
VAQFKTPDGSSGQAELTAASGLEILDQGLWRYSQAGYNDGITFGLSIVGPDARQRADFYGGDAQGTAPMQSGGELHLRAQGWTIAHIGNQLQSWTDPDTGVTYGADRCQIRVQGRWVVARGTNSNSMNSQGCMYHGHTRTDLGDRIMTPTLLTLETVSATYVIQGADVEGGAQDTFTPHVWFCRCTETVTTDNSNRSFQSNTLVSPRWVYQYQRSWQID